MFYRNHQPPKLTDRYLDRALRCCVYMVIGLRPVSTCTQFGMGRPACSKQNGSVMSQWNFHTEIIVKP
ncbi:hypothetical protein HanXRQr2_Chr02g0073611 [Helianthus annuus]|uniref:Uncharacterized protein n=1 Tax=Helianthus annuus TaxID=4232 RepID=A0A9K3P1P0_HELAN|nr:hypothetical protein HanXRQr2_Chr02g0073611 [Helianthus annuus]